MRLKDLSRLSLSGFHFWPKALKKATLFGFNMVFIGLAYCLLLQTQIKFYHAQQRIEKSLKTDFEQKQAQLASAKRLAHDLSVLKSAFAQHLRQFPNRLSPHLGSRQFEKNYALKIPELLGTLSKIGLELGLRFELLAPEPEIKRNFYVGVPVKIILRGGYFEFASFISRVTELNAPLSFSEFHIKQARGGRKDELLVHLLITYYTARFL